MDNRRDLLLLLLLAGTEQRGQDCCSCDGSAAGWKHSGQQVEILQGKDSCDSKDLSVGPWESCYRQSYTTTQAQSGERNRGRRAVQSAVSLCGAAAIAPAREGGIAVPLEPLR